MNLLDIKNLYRETDRYLNQNITVAGWVRTVRLSKDFGFIELNDGTFLKNLQIVFDKGLSNFLEIEKLSLGSAIKVDGQLVKSPAPLQPFELKADHIEVVGLSDNSYPLQKKKHSLEFLREIAHLRVRTTTFSSVFRVRSALSSAIHQFFQERGFSYVHTPIISSSDCEGAGEMFTVTTMDLTQPIVKTPTGQVDYRHDFFGQRVGLTVSGQLEAEALIFGLNRVYTFGPTFRAENSNTTRHACEFWMVEPEVAFADLADITDLAEEMVKYLINYILQLLPEEIKFFNDSVDDTLMERLQKTLKANFIRLSYTEAIDLLLKSKEHFQYPVSWGMDLQTEHERYITENIFGQPVFLTDYPKDIKAFYMRQNDDGRTVAAVDLLVPGVGEIVGGGQREERLTVLEERIDELKMNKKDYGWYLDLRRFGSIKHAGFGLGFERFIMYLTGIANIRDVIPFPRTPKNAKF